LISQVLAYGFWGPGLMKWKNLHKVVEWFGSMVLSFPSINAEMAALTEVG
jgi:putative oxidoreductase